MTEIEFNYSLKGRKCTARWYPKRNGKNDRFTIFLNKIDINPETEFNNFLAELMALELHELGHIMGFRSGCRGCKGRNCWYCQLTDMLYYYFKKGIWYQGYTNHLKNTANVIKLSKMPFEERMKLIPIKMEPI